MNNPPLIENFITSPPRIVSVGGARATVRGLIDAPLIIARTQVRHPLIVVEDILFPLLLGIRMVLTTHNSVPAPPAPSDLTSNDSRSATKSAHLLHIFARFQPLPSSVRTSASSHATPHKSLSACHLQFSATCTLSRNLYLHLSPIPAAQLFHQ